VNQDFEDLLAHLNAEGVKYLIIGAYAVAVHAQPRGTKDLDIFIGTDRANGEAVWRALAKLGAPGADIPPHEMAEPGTFFTWGVPPFRVDIITSISGVEFDDAWSRRLVHSVNEVTGLTVPFISAEDLIRNKETSGREAGREQDIADVAAVRRAAAEHDLAEPPDRNADYEWRQMEITRPQQEDRSQGDGDNITPPNEESRSEDEHGRPAMARAQPHEPETPMTREEFLAWVEQQPSGRFERIDGIVVAMAPERASHNRRKRAAHDALEPAVTEAGLTSCEVFVDGMTVQVEDSDYEPDALLRCGPRLSGDATRISDPLVLIEVLSPDSGARDRATKLRAYFKLPSVQHYLIVWPEEQRIVRHSRMPGDRLATQVFVSGDIRLDPPGIIVAVEEFYVD